MRPRYALRAARLLRRYYSSNVSSTSQQGLLWSAESFPQRVTELNERYKHGQSGEADTVLYPRVRSSEDTLSVPKFNSWFEKLGEETPAADEQEKRVTESQLRRLARSQKHYTLNGMCSNSRVLWVAAKRT